MDLSVVIPVYNEEKNLPMLCQQVQEALSTLGRTYEIIVVDDGSSDGSFGVLARLHRQDPGIKVIRFCRNFGQTAALAAGFAYASGEIIVSLDGDLQNDPADIPRLIAKLEEGYDLVSGWRVNRQDPFLLRRLPSQIANRIISFNTKVKLHDYVCTLKALRKEVAKGLMLYGEMHRFIPALAGDIGAAITEIPVNHRPRQQGRSKYGLARTLWVILDLLTVKFLSGYATRPGHLFGLLGLLAMVVGGVVTSYLGVQRLFFQMDIGGRPLLLLGVLLVIIGAQFITMGLLGEMLVRTYHESQGKPIYVIKEVLDE